MKLLILTIIVLAVPMFFAFVFAMSTVNKLKSLRNRCREIRECIRATCIADSRAAPGVDPQTRADFNQAMESYDAARKKFPANLLAVLCGFHEMEPLPDQQVSASREAQ